MPRNKKKPTQKKYPANQCSPRGIKKAEKNEDSVLVWDTKLIDTGGPWSWNNITGCDWWEHICPAKHNFSTMKWSEIVGDRHHPIDVEQIIPEAQKRLEEIQNEDIDSLYSFAIGGKPRIWGIRDRNIFRVLWWDPDHEICPAPKKYT